MKVNFLSFTSGNKPIIGGKFPKKGPKFSYGYIQTNALFNSRNDNL